MTPARRTLLVYSAPVVLVVVLFAAKLISVVVAGNAAVSNFERSDAAALSDNADTLRTVNIVEPGKAYFAAGTAAALQKRFDDADRELTLALERTAHEESCPVRFNLELVRESLGDNAAAIFEPQAAVDHYLAARRVVEQAPVGCFTDEAVRLDAKIAGVAAPPPPPPPGAPPVSVPVAPVPGSSPQDDRERLLNPGLGDPLERLQQILRDAAE